MFQKAGGIFGSINHDTYDPHENVAYSVALRTLWDVAGVLDDDTIRTFAYEKCLAGLDQFKMHEDRNGVETKGLLYMEKSWDTAYLWENAEAALACFEAAVEPTLYYLEHLARKAVEHGQVQWRDLEGNVLLRRPATTE